MTINSSDESFSEVFQNENINPINKNTTKHPNNHGTSNKKHQLPAINMIISRPVAQHFTAPHKLAAEIKRCFPSNYKSLAKTIKFASFSKSQNKTNKLKIATDDQKSYQFLSNKSNWPKDAFINGDHFPNQQVTTETKECTFSISNIDETIEDLASQGIHKPTRVFNKNNKHAIKIHKSHR